MSHRLGAFSATLPDFPWDRLVPFGDQARRHPEGLVDLSIGTPVDPTPEVVQQALADAADAPGYPLTAGRADTRAACRSWLTRRLGVLDVEPDGVLPLIGSKEFIASVALHLGLGAGDLIAYPGLAYPTYEVGAALAGAESVAIDSLTSLGPRVPRLLWLNSPANPTGQVLPVDHLRKVVDWCRQRGTILISDECYIEMVWDTREAAPMSVLHPDVCDGDTSGIVAVHSLSKRSNLAGYRCGFAAGDPVLIRELLGVRKNLGLMMPGPQQHAMVAALDDDDHVTQQRRRYAERRAILGAALEDAGFRIDHSQGSLYLWATREEDCWDTVSWFADRGILVAPGAFYGRAGHRHVRVAFTATDADVAAAAARLGDD